MPKLPHIDRPKLQPMHRLTSPVYMDKKLSSNRSNHSKSSVNFLIRVIAGLLGVFVLFGVIWLLLIRNDLAKPASPQQYFTLNHSMPAPLSVNPTDFAFIPCTRAQMDIRDPAQCVLVIAGGKKFAFGVPAGSVGRLGTALKGLDAVLLFGLSADYVEGLDEIRNISWILGRDTPLNLFGPEGVQTVSKGINTVLEMADAITYIRENGDLTFDAAPLIPNIINTLDGNKEVINTGDVRILAYPASNTSRGEEVFYRIEYRNMAALIGGCALYAGDMRSTGSLDIIFLPVNNRILFAENRRVAIAEGRRKMANRFAENAHYCFSVAEAASNAKQVGARMLVASPALPEMHSELSQRIWQKSIEGIDRIKIELAHENTVVFLTPQTIHQTQFIQ